MEEEYLAMLRAFLPDGWEIDSEVYGYDVLLIAPDGCAIEQDGTCPHGYQSPLRSIGLI